MLTDPMTQLLDQLNQIINDTEDARDGLDQQVADLERFRSELRASLKAPGAERYEITLNPLKIKEIPF